MENNNNTSIKCPYCSTILVKIPVKKTKCNSCGNYIYVRTRPGEKTKIFITETQVSQVEKEWEEYLYKRDILSAKQRNMDKNSYALPELLRAKKMENDSGMKLVATIIASGCCESCKKDDNRSLTIDEALNQMIIPHTDCTGKYGCTCVYTVKRVE